MSAEQKFTPGPWRIRKGPRHSPDECDLTICGDIFLLADINGPNYPHCEPNARLIAVAPDLAQSVRDLLALHEAHHNNPVHAAARAILAKAEARS